MQPLDALTLKHLASELDVKLADGKVNKIQQASHTELLLHFWVGGDAGRQKLYISIKPELAFCALLGDTSFQRFPEKAPNFCMVLRKHITSARVKRVEALRDERVLNIEFDNYNELGQYVQPVLSIELMGKNSPNIILYDAELKTIIGCAHGVSETMSRLREISVGYPYVPPPPQLQPSLHSITPETFRALISQGDTAAEQAGKLVQAFRGTGKAVLTDLLSSNTSHEAAYSQLQDLLAGQRLYPSIQADWQGFSLLPAHTDNPAWTGVASINAMVGGYHQHQMVNQQMGMLRHRYGQVLDTQAKRLEKRLAELDRTDADALLALKYGGDLLTVACGTHTERLTEPHITLANFETGEPVTLEIDPTLSLAENAQRYYRRYKKAQARATIAAQQRAQFETGLAFIAELRQTMARAETLADLDAVAEDMRLQTWLPPLNTGKKASAPVVSAPMQTLLGEGFTVLVGRNGTQNDQLAGKLAKPWDIWMHAHLNAGSHILIRTEKRPVPPAVLEDAASLAAYYSQARGGANVPVIYTEARYVRKIPNSYPGHVTYTHEQSLNITPDPQRIVALTAPAKASDADTAPISEQ